MRKLIRAIAPAVFLALLANDAVIADEVNESGRLPQAVYRDAQSEDVSGDQANDTDVVLDRSSHIDDELMGLFDEVQDPDAVSNFDAIEGDEAFERFVNLESLAAAIAAMDGQELCDVVLALANAEQVLQRSHLSGITSDILFDRITSLAMKRGDDELVQRLVKGGTRVGKESWEVRSEEMREFHSKSRAPSPQMRLDDVKLANIGLRDAVIFSLEQAEFVGDAEIVAAVRDIVEKENDLSKEERADLLKRIKAAEEAVSVKGQDQAVLHEFLSSSRGGSYDSDRNAVRARIAGGGWEIVWGVTVNEAEYAKLLAAIASSVASSNPGPLLKYFNDYLNRTIEKVQRNAPGVARQALWNAVIRAMRDRGRAFRVGKIGVKGGIATYRRWKKVSMHVPDGTEKYKIYGPRNPFTGKRTWTWGYRPKMKLVERTIPLPNHHQPFIGFRIYPTSSGGGSSGGSNAIRYTISNETSWSIRFQLPSGRWYTLHPGQSGSYSNSRPNPRIHIPNSNSNTYALSSGRWHLIPLGNNRIGFGKW